MARGDGYTELMSMWSIQESLLQAYRSIFITAQSVVFAIAAAVSTLSPWSAIVLAALGVVLLVIWQMVTSNRARDVSFVQWLLLQAEEGHDVPSPLKLFKEFQGGLVVTVGTRSVWRSPNPDPKGLVNDVPFVNLGKSPSRRWMEVWLPYCFWALWVIVAVMALSSIIKCPAP